MTPLEQAAEALRVFAFLAWPNIRWVFTSERPAAFSEHNEHGSAGVWAVVSGPFADFTLTPNLDSAVTKARAALARLDAEQARIIDAREKVAQWMIAHSYATGHGDTIDDLLNELSGQVATRIAKLEEKLSTAGLRIASLEAEKTRVPPDRERLVKAVKTAGDWFLRNEIFPNEVVLPLYEAAAALRAPTDSLPSDLSLGEALNDRSRPEEKGKKP